MGVILLKRAFLSESKKMFSKLKDWPRHRKMHSSKQWDTLTCTMMNFWIWARTLFLLQLKTTLCKVLVTDLTPSKKSEKITMATQSSLNPDFPMKIRYWSLANLLLVKHQIRNSNSQQMIPSSKRNHLSHRNHLRPKSRLRKSLKSRRAQRSFLMMTISPPPLTISLDSSNRLWDSRSR